MTATALWPTATDVPPTATEVLATATATASPTETPTATFTPLPSGMVLAAGPIREGPGTIYPTAAQLVGGETATPLGQTEAGDWYLIALSNAEGWVPADNFTLSLATSDLPVITDLPPTPTVPPATATPAASVTPAPTSTNPPSPFSCDVSISPGTSPPNIIVVGQGWPPDAPVTLVYTGATYSYTNTWDFHSGAANSNNPGGFWRTRWGDPSMYTFSAEGCSRSVVYA